MSKTISWPTRVIYVVLALALALSMAMVALPKAQVGADPGSESEWDDVSTPSKDDFVIAPGSEILDFDMSPDGETIYAVVKINEEGEIDGNPYTEDDTILLKSTDSGATWSDKTKELPGDTPTELGLKLVSVAPNDADFVVVATDGEVYASNKGGDDFHVTEFSGDAGGTILCLDVSPEADDVYNIAVGTDAGKVWRYQAGEFWPGHWVDATDSTEGYAGWQGSTAVTSVAFSPDWSSDKTVLAITSDPYPYELQTEGAGTAEWSTAQASDGSYSVEVTLPTANQVDDAARVAIPMPAGTILNDISTVSFEWMATTPTSDVPKPYVTFAMDADGDGEADTWVAMACNPVASEPPNPDTDWFSEAEVDEFTDETVGTGAEFDLWHVTTGVYSVPISAPKSLADITTFKGTSSPEVALGTLPVLEVKVGIGLSGYWLAETAYVDDITIDGFTYPLEPATYLQTGKWGTQKGWNTEVNYAPAVKLTDEPATISGIALPSDYSGFDAELRTSWVFAGDTVCRVENSLSKEFCPAGEAALASIAFHGTVEDGGKLMLGVLLGGPGDCDGVQVFRTDEVNICCPAWKGSTKKPSGGSNALVAFTPDGNKAYAVTQGDESAFSVSLDDGRCWNQLSLIDTGIDHLSDVAVSPDCTVTYLSSMNAEGGCDSVWMKDANADEYADVWQRVFHKALGGNGLLRLSPEHEDGDVVYWGDQGHKNLYWAESKGICRWSSRTTTLDVQDFAIADDDTIYVIDDGGDIAAFVWGTHDWSPEEDTKVGVGHSVAVLGDYILVGGEGGKVSYSDDMGDSFAALDNAGSAGDNVHVAFDSYFADNGVVYAASDSIYRCSDLEEGEWTDFKSYCATEGDLTFTGIVLDNADGNPMTDEDTGGVLYATYEGVGVAGMARVLGAASSKDEDYLTNGVPDGTTFTAQPSALRICDSGNSLLWAIDTSSPYGIEKGKDNLFVYEDCLSKAGVTLTSVADGKTVAADACLCENAPFVLKWDDLCNSFNYELQIALDKDFDLVVKPTGATLGAGDEYVLIPKGALDCSTTYYWRARVVEADSGAETIRSWWSEPRSFTVAAGPGAAIGLTAPESGAANVAIEGVVFTWTAVAEVTGYDFTLMDASGAAIDSKTGLTGTSYAYAGTLDYATAYTWKVTAMKDGSVLSESSVATFTTASAPAAAVWTCAECGLTFSSEAALKAHIAEAHAPVEAGTPAWVWVVIGIGAVLVITVIVLIFRTRRI